MHPITCYSISEIEQRTCRIISKYFDHPREAIRLDSRMVEDLHFDSLCFVELLMQLEQEFQVEIPARSQDSVLKSLFTRSPFRVSDLVEIIVIQQGTSPPEHSWQRKKSSPLPLSPGPRFTQLSGRWSPPSGKDADPLFDHLEKNGRTKQVRRRSDGMRCIVLPAAEVEIGSDQAGLPSDEQPCHVVQIDSFAIDAEPVSTTAFCRFLNSIDGITAEDQRDWFLLDHSDRRQAQMQIAQGQSGWEPRPGTEQMPMILVSWFAASAYSLWANGQDWKRFRKNDDAGIYLPTEAQWEYAARGTQYQHFPWGNEIDPSSPFIAAQSSPGTSYEAATMPLGAVHERSGMSPFGLHHMAGNIWQWCRDWYDDSFYQSVAAREPNPVNRQPTGVRSERGGSWVGPAALCRSSCRRGRNPSARGRCLGFRCISDSRIVRAHHQ